MSPGLCQQELLQFTMSSQLDPLEDESGSNISGEEWDGGSEGDPPAGRSPFAKMDLR